MAYGTLKVDNLTYTSGGSDASTSVSGIVALAEGNFNNITATGTISGATITGNTGQFTTITAVTGIFTTTLSGATVTGVAAQFTNVTGGAAGFTTVTGQTVTGTAGQFGTVTGNTAGFTTITGQTVTGSLGQFTSGTIKDLVVTNSLVSPSGTDFSVAGNIVVGGSGYFSSGISITGTVSGQTITGTAGQFGTVTGNTAGFTTVTGTTVTGTTGSFTTVTGQTVNDNKGNVRAIPQNAQSSTYTLVIGDAGKHIAASGSVTVPASVFSAGDAIGIYNNSASNISITQGTSTTLRQAGTANTGTRTLAQRGIATVLCVASNEFVVNGAGLS